MTKITEIICSICGRKTPKEYAEKHHLVPKCKKGKDIILLCCDCGDQIHKFFSPKELARHYNSLEALKNAPQVQKWIEWISKRKEFRFCMKGKKKKIMDRYSLALGKKPPIVPGHIYKN